MKEKELVKHLEKSLFEELQKQTRKNPKKKYAEKKPKITRPGVGSIFYGKFLDWLEENEASAFFKRVGKLALFGLVAYGLFYPDRAVEAWNNFLVFRDSFFLKSFIAGILILKIEKLFWLLLVLFDGLKLVAVKFWSIFGGIKTKPKADNRVEEISSLIYDVPIEDILSHLVNVGTFRLKEVCSLGMTKRNFEKLSSKLKTIGVIFKDPEQNNSFVVSEKFSTELLAEILLDNSPAEEIKRRLRSEEVIVSDSPTRSTSPSQLFTKTQIA